MDPRNIVVMPGDGIGKMLLPEAIRVLDAAGFKANYVPADIGWEFWCKEGNALRSVPLLCLKNTGSPFRRHNVKPKDRADLN
jgi:3-isopropylmalate dehydrogenase